MPECVWTLDDEDGNVWRASCADPQVHLFEFSNDHGPTGNHFAFCPYCGQPLVEARPEPVDVFTEWPEPEPDDA